MARRLILPLILLVALTGLLVYVGGERYIQYDFVMGKPEQGLYISMQAAIGIGAGIIVGIILLWSLLVWLWALPNRMKKGIGRRRGEHGLDAVEQALLAVEAGDGHSAVKKAKKASELLNRPALTTLIAAKAAEASGSHDAAHAHYTALKNQPETETAGLRGLARLSQTQGDHAAILETAQAAFSKADAPEWAFDALYAAQTAQGDWASALETLTSAEKRKLKNKDILHRRRAVILSALAQNFEREGDTQKALEYAKQAADLASDFAPGVALAAKLLAQTGQHKKAAHLIEKAWARAPHPALALAYRDLWFGENEKTTAKKIKHLIKTNPRHRESQILAAEQALKNKDGVAALSALDDFIQDPNPSARICTLVAQAENLLNNPVDANMWKNRAMNAPIEADWSDLDPDGSAFNYTDADWERLARSFGDDGTLIHPRHETFQSRRPVIPHEVVQKTAQNGQDSKDTPTERAERAETPPTPDDPGVDDKGTDKQDLADRLQNLLDD